MAVAHSYCYKFLAIGTLFHFHIPQYLLLLVPRMLSTVTGPVLAGGTTCTVTAWDAAVWEAAPAAAGLGRISLVVETAGAGLAVKAAGSGRIFLVVETAGAGLAVKAAGAGLAVNAAGAGLAVKAAGSGRFFLVVETAGAGLAVKAAGLVLAVETAGMPTAVETGMGKLPERGVIGGRVALETAAAVEETVVLGIAEVVPFAITPIACRIVTPVLILSQSFFMAFLFLYAAFLAFCEEKTKHSRVHKHVHLLFIASVTYA